MHVGQNSPASATHNAWSVGVVVGCPQELMDAFEAYVVVGCLVVGAHTGRGYLP